MVIVPKAKTQRGTLENIPVCRHDEDDDGDVDGSGARGMEAKM